MREIRLREIRLREIRLRVIRLGEIRLNLRFSFSNTYVLDLLNYRILYPSLYDAKHQVYMYIDGDV